MKKYWALSIALVLASCSLKAMSLTLEEVGKRNVKGMQNALSILSQPEQRHLVSFLVFSAPPQNSPEGQTCLQELMGLGLAVETGDKSKGRSVIQPHLVTPYAAQAVLALEQMCKPQEHQK